MPEVAGVGRYERRGSGRRVVIPDQVVDGKKTITLGGTRLELIFVGRNHSDNSLVMRLPKEKLVFVVDFAPIEAMQRRDDWEAAGQTLANIARRLEASGAGLIGLATNTMHICAPAILAALHIPLVHIATPTAAALVAADAGNFRHG